MLAIDYVSSYQSLQLYWASKTNCVQRAGRAGRVMDGRVFRLVPKQFYQNVLDNEGTPEMLRAPLANTVLRAKLLDFGDPHSLLSLSLDPPSLHNLSNTILSLKEIGALINDKDVSTQDLDGKLSDLGRIMAHLPIDTHISKLIMLGHAFGILRDAIVLGASMALKDVFLDQYRPTISSYSMRRTWARDTDSDCIASLNVYRTWQNEIANRRLTSHEAEKQWARRNEIKLRTLRELDALVNEITRRLARLNVKDTVGVNKVIWEGSDRDFALQVILAGAFYPNYFIKRSKNPESYEHSVLRNLNGLDPLRSVFLRGWPEKQPGYLYAQKLQKIFSEYQGIAKDCISVSFDQSKRVYVQFHEKGMTRNDKSLYRISDCVYKAVKMRQNKIPIEVGLLSVSDALQRSKNQNFFKKSTLMFRNEKIGKERTNSLRIRPRLPGIDVALIFLSIRYIVSPGCFWAVIDDENTRKDISTIETILTAHPLREFNSRPEISTLVAAPMKKEGSLTYQRAIIENCTSEIADIFFIDYGYSSRVRFSDLRAIDDITILELPSLVFHCALAFIRPSNQFGNLQGHWSKISQDCFKCLITESKEVHGKIYSVVNGIVNLELIVINDKKERLNINEHLIEEGYAIRREENYLSRYNHDLRTGRNIAFLKALSSEQKLFYEEQQYEDNWLLEYPNPPEEENCHSYVKLHGPYSPLEIELVQLTKIGKYKKVVIEPYSVNSVLLDEDFHHSTQLLIAQTVTQVINTNQLVLRNTTLLPNVPGLTIWLLLIFAPCIELRRSPLGNVYIGALCGLGPMDDYTERSIFMDHDIYVPFDVEISLNDLRDINKLRHWINIGMQLQQNSDCEHDDNDDDESMINCQNHIQCTLLELRDRYRRPQNPIEIDNFDKWNLYDSSMFLHPARDTGKNNIYSLHKALELREKNDELEQMIKHLAKLNQLAHKDACKEDNIGNSFCKLCEVGMFGLLNLRSHLCSEQHIKNEENLKIKLMPYYASMIDDD